MQEMASEIHGQDSPLWQNASWWYHATPLTERITLQQKNTDSYNSSILHNPDKAKQRLQRWREQAPFDKGEYFARRLAMDALTEEDLLILLDEPMETLQTDDTPSWFIELFTAFTKQTTSADFTWQFSATGQNTQMVSFLNTLKPLLKNVLVRLQAGIQELTQRSTSLPFDPKTIVSLLFAQISTLIFPKLSKTVVLELHVARVQGRLQGETSEERFQSFLEQLNQRENMLKLLEEYAVLARQLVEMLDRWVTCELELLERLCADWGQIQSVFAPDYDPGILVEIQQEAGDTHRGGHNVTILTWSSGFRLVYKPRAMALDVHFQELLTWLNAQGQQPAFRILSIIDKQTYGYRVLPTTKYAVCCAQREPMACC